MELNTADDYFDAFKHYAALHRAYSGKFILNTRPREHWVRSIMMHKKVRWGRRKLLQHYDLRFGTTDLNRVADLWREAWEEHHRRVREEIPAGILLEFDIESEPARATVRFCRRTALMRAFLHAGERDDEPVSGASWAPVYRWRSSTTSRPV